MKHRVIISCLAAAAFSILQSESAFAAGDDPVELDEITVTAVPEEEGGTAGSPDSLVAALRVQPLLSISSQGGSGAQNDISILGSSFSGAGLSLAGIALQHPQTEHFHAELPLPSSILMPPGVLTGMDQALASDGHLVGTVDLDFAPIGDRILLDLGAGTYAWRWHNLLFDRPLASSDRWGSFGAGAFVVRESAERVDYEDNDLERQLGGMRFQHQTARYRSDLVVGLQKKKFGVRGYYGVDPALPGEEEFSDSIVVFSARRNSHGGMPVKFSAVWRETEDDYLLHLDDSEVFANSHESRILAMSADGGWTFLRGSGAMWRLSAEEEKLDSNSLGNRRRKRGAWQLIPFTRLGWLEFKGGVRGEMFDDDSPAVLPQVGVEAKTAEHLVLYASYTATVRQPSYTELNYESPGSLGNAGLERQEADAFEAGLRWKPSERAGGRVMGFFRRGRNTVDWVKDEPDSTRWVASDLGVVDTRGAHAEAWCRPSGDLYLRISHTWLGKDSDADPFASRYVLDYPEYLATLLAEWKMSELWRLRMAQEVRRQTANPARDGSRTGTEGSASVHFFPCGTEGPRLAAAVDNLWNDQFQTLPGQDVADRRVSVSVSIEW